MNTMPKKYPDTFYEAILEAIEHDGKITLQGFDIRRYSDRFDALRSVSQWGGGGELHAHFPKFFIQVIVITLGFAKP